MVERQLILPAVSVNPERYSKLGFLGKEPSTAVTIGCLSSSWVFRVSFASISAHSQPSPRSLLRLRTYHPSYSLSAIRVKSVPQARIGTVRLRSRKGTCTSSQSEHKSLTAHSGRKASPATSDEAAGPFQLTLPRRSRLAGCKARRCFNPHWCAAGGTISYQG